MSLDSSRPYTSLRNQDGQPSVFLWLNSEGNSWNVFADAVGATLMGAVVLDIQKNVFFVVGDDPSTSYADMRTAAEALTHLKIHQLGRISSF